MSKGPRSRRVTKDYHKFSVQVDAAAFNKANAARTKTWPEITEEMLRLTAIGVRPEAILNTLIDVLVDLKFELDGDFVRAPEDYAKKIKRIEAFIDKVRAVL